MFAKDRAGAFLISPGAGTSMADDDFRFTVDPTSVAPLGPVSKENYDIIRVFVDYTPWLEVATAEGIGSVMFPSVAVAATPDIPWQVDYPLNAAIAACAAVPDDYPLGVVGVTITGATVEVLLAAGT